MRTWFCRASPTLKNFGTMINVTGRIQRLNRAIQPIGYARDDWQIFRDITLLLGGNPALKDFNSALDILTAMSTEYGALNWSLLGFHRRRGPAHSGNRRHHSRGGTRKKPGPLITLHTHTTC